MAHNQQQNFCKKIKEKYPEFFINKKVLDVGSLDVNGNNRFLFDSCDYLGIDVAEGNNVDVVALGHLFNAPDNYYDVIISTEVFEHDMFYKQTIQNIMRMLKPGGMFLFTCATIGRKEHGTILSDDSEAAPLLKEISNEWANYYKNLQESDIRDISGFNETFPDGYFEYEQNAFDLYFFGIKYGLDNILYQKMPTPIYTNFNNNHIFLIDSWIDTNEKQKMLIECIRNLKLFNIEIALISHNSIIPEIQKMVDYFIFDKQNPILLYKDFDKYQVGSGRWSETPDYRTEIKYNFHHDYAIWRAMDVGFNFCKMLNKKYIHFLEYDTIPNAFQYKQAFLEKIYDYDAVIYEYQKHSKDTHLSDYCATYIFSVKTDIACKSIKNISSIEEYFSNKPNGFQLERVFLTELKKQTNNILVSPYIANDNELNQISVWNRDGELRFECRFQSYPCVDNDGNLYVELIHDFYEKDENNNNSYLLEIIYKNFKKFIQLNPNDFKLILLGDYNKGERLIINHMGREVFNCFFDMNYEEYKKLNFVKNNNNNTIYNINYINGAFCEILSPIKKKYTIEFINNDTGEIIYETNITNNCWAKTLKQYFINWKINIKQGTTLIKTFLINLNNQRVYIAFDSESLGDTIAWFPYVYEFKKKHNCHVIVSTFWNELFKNEYPDIEFVTPGKEVHNIIAMYTLGCFEPWGQNFEKNPIDFRTIPLQKIATDILGLEYKEIKPKIVIPNTNRLILKKYVCITEHSTAQAKYWNNPTGWQDIANFLIKNGYEVVALGKGDCNLKNVINKTGTLPLPELLNLIYYSDFFIGIPSGLSWLAWALNKNVIMISGFSKKFTEFSCYRIINENVCNGCWNNPKYVFDKSDWMWCPINKNTDKQFECTKKIASEMVIQEIKKLI